MDEDVIPFDTFVRHKPIIIKVVGVGGGGCNAVNHMWEQGVKGVSFAVCNTDSSSLNMSGVNTRLLLGKSGLGVGGDPVQGRLEAEMTLGEIREMLSDGTKMLFLTAGLGGGTGTGAAPVIAREARKMGILTAAIVTLPFRYEGLNRIDCALEGLEDLTASVDSIMVVNNERLFEAFPTNTHEDAFRRVDDMLCVATQSILDIIHVHGEINPDFADVSAVLRDGGVSIISTAYAEGVDRLSHAINEAVNTPLLNNCDVYKSQHLLMTIFTSNANDGEPLVMTELNEVATFMEHFDMRLNCKHAIGIDTTLGKKVKVTILASGFGLEALPDDEDIYGQPMHRFTRGERLTRLYKSFYNQESYKRWNVFEFQASQLDDDDLIREIENSPTYIRTSRFVGNLRMRGPQSSNSHPSIWEQQDSASPAQETAAEPIAESTADNVSTSAPTTAMAETSVQPSNSLSTPQAEADNILVFNDPLPARDVNIITFND